MGFCFFVEVSLGLLPPPTQSFLPLFSSFIRSEWVTNQHRDTYTSMIAHDGLLDYVALMENESRERARFELLQVSLFISFLSAIHPSIHPRCSLHRHTTQDTRTQSCHFCSLPSSGVLVLYSHLEPRLCFTVHPRSPWLARSLRPTSA